MRNFKMEIFHTSVLLREAIEYLRIEKGQKYIDTTLGGGGHTLEIIKHGGIVLGIDQDTEALGFVKKNFKFGISNNKLQIAQGNFKDIKKIAFENNFRKVAGILFDLGVSNYQLNTAERGFSFMKNAALDMRMDKQLSVTAADLINGLNKQELLELFTKLGEEIYAWKIVPAVLKAREKKKIETTEELAGIVENLFPGRKEKIHPATKIFQALRIAVNDELNNLKDALPQALELLQQHGRLVVIAFHSHEDRIVKNAFLTFEKEDSGTILSKKPVIPDEKEIEKNPKSRSAKMRVFEKM